jgi:hypothetical protein
MRTNKQSRTGPSKRTAAQRAAIDKRAAAYPHPLSGTQVRALKLLAKTRSLVHVRAGWHPIEDCSLILLDRTLDALIKRGFASVGGHIGSIVITGAGRAEARRHR